MVVPFYQDSLACYIMSGLLTFFLLAGFQWNTSICLEALLITLSFRMSGEDEGWRYILHSLWAWGVPGLITSLALTLNYYRASLPCSVITPRIGLPNCFFSDQKAKLVYLYMPMLLTLCANTSLLVASRCVRSANLRRLEKGSVESITAEDGRTVVTSRHSGLRSHRTQNLLTEGVIMVMWSGAMWFMEVIAFLVAFNSDEPSHAWYNYLWYIPSGLNCLRGIGIFLIVVLTPENRSKLARTCNRVIRSMTACNYKARSSNLTARSRSSDVQAVGIRRFNMSIHEGIDQNTDVTSDETLSSSLADSELGPGIGEADVSAKRHKKSQ
ncbi:probable G-protein coupled receptor Mth-like 1 [Procambarus clarkii]|uniref:probable G-protein coupled receptor Mth-like 1 n=1 Tax=Procambarus clarkii TaxID=6728 RepID=UPI001E676C00|nr:probable G-protein coupled receptor Mth-like 1 [Procambarus clarkii]